MHPAIVPLASGYALHTRLFLNCLDGLDDAGARTRPNGHTNSIGFIALHLVEARHLTIGFSGAEAPPNPFAELLDGIRGIEGLAAYPSLAEIREAWRSVSVALTMRLAEMDHDDVSAPSPRTS